MPKGKNTLLMHCIYRIYEHPYQKLKKRFDKTYLDIVQKFKGPKTERSHLIKGLKHMYTESFKKENKETTTSEYVSMKPKIIIN